MDIQQLRKQAKELVKEARGGDAEALARLEGRAVKLASAQLVVARENGFASWPALVTAAEAGADSFVMAATSNRPARARAYLEAKPEILRDPWARLVAGESWDGDVTASGGPRGWPPIVYAAHSCLTTAASVEDLISRGADVNAGPVDEWGRRTTALYGASGVLHDPDKTRILLGAGADPDDWESLYHATESADTTCLEMLLAAGATIEGTNALAHALDFEAIAPVKALLDAGADASRGFYISHAIPRGRGPDVVRVLAEHGAPVDAPGGETWRGDVPLRTPYQHAVLRARDDIAAVLTELGADTAVDPSDLAVACLARGAAPTGPLPAEPDVDQQEVIVLAALNGHLDAVVDAVGPGFRGVVGGSPTGTLLHHACWVGSPDAVQRLLDRGADPLARSETEMPTPLGWAAGGSEWHRIAGRDYVAVAEILVAAGDAPTAAMADAADGPLHEWLAERS